MGYKVIPNACEGYTKRAGLEGPFNMAGRVLYYDPKEGAYWNPKTDFYMSNDEMDIINKDFHDMMSS